MQLMNLNTNNQIPSLPISNNLNSLLNLQQNIQPYNQFPNYDQLVYSN